MDDIRYLREELQVLVRGVRDEMRAWFEAMKQQRLEDRAMSTQRHSENIGRFAKQDEKLESIDDQVHLTNGRVTKAEEQIKSLFRQVESLVSRLTGPRGERGEQGERGERGDERAVSRIDLRYLILAFGAGGAVVVWLLHLMGKV